MHNELCTKKFLSLNKKKEMPQKKQTKNTHKNKNIDDKSDDSFYLKKIL